MQKDKLQLYFLFALILIVLLIFSNELTGYQAASLTLFFLVFINFIFDLGSHISIKNIIVLLMVMQWLVGPVLGYIYDKEIEPSYQMKVSQEVYFGYVLPATLAFMAGLYIKLRKVKYKPNFDTTIDYFQKGRLLIIIGFVFEFLPWFGFLGYLLAGLKYVGVFYMVLSPNRKRYYWISFVFGYLFVIRSLGTGFFHELLLWTLFLLILVFYFNRKSFMMRIAVISFGLFFAFVLQLVKPAYRKQMVTSTENGKLVLFFDMVSTKLTDDEPLYSDEELTNNIVRLNQGWIISNVMNYIPSKRPFANGQTINDAIVASIFPRFLLPEKAMAGGRDNMKNYAGINLSETTSMDISQVGEAYANFGVIGGIIMMFVLGLFLNGVITFIEKKCLKHPELILWLPLIFIQVIKAETSLVTVLNHLAKASLLTWFFFTPTGAKFLQYRLGWIKVGVRTLSLIGSTKEVKGVRPRKGIEKKGKKFRTMKE